jgi:hypothetical protein
MFDVGHKFAVESQDVASPFDVYLERVVRHLTRRRIVLRKILRNRRASIQQQSTLI